MLKLFLVDVTSFENRELYERGLHLVSSQRREKIMTLHKMPDRFLSLGAGLLLRYAFLTVEGKDLSEEILLGNHGQPFLPNRNIYFSLSHSKNLALCAISDTPIGCDIEVRREKVPRLLKKVFTAEEMLAYDTLSPEMKRQFFFETWTRKESFVKWMGRGIGFHFSEISVSTEGKMKDSIIYGGDTLRIKSYTQGEYEIAICSQNSDFPEEIQRIAPELLTKY